MTPPPAPPPRLGVPPLVPTDSASFSRSVRTHSSSCISIPQLLSMVASFGHISRSPIVAVSYRNSRVGFVAICLNCFQLYAMTTVTFPSHSCPKSFAKSKASRLGARSRICVHRCRHSDSKKLATTAHAGPMDANHRFTLRMGTMCGFVWETMK